MPVNSANCPYVPPSWSRSIRLTCKPCRGSDDGYDSTRPTKADVFSHSDGLSGDNVTNFLEDREGNIWVATYDGIDRFREYAIPTISTKQGLSNRAAWSVLATKDSSVWIATNGGLNRWRNGDIALFGNGAGTKKPDGKLDGSPPISLCQGNSGSIWASNIKGEIGYLTDDRFIPIPGLQGGTVYSMAEVSQGDLWVSYQPQRHLWTSDKDAALFHVSAGRVLQKFRWADLERKDYAKVIIPDASQRGLWLGFHRGGVAYFTEGGIRALYSAHNGLAEGEVTDLSFGTRGELWAATATGLSRIKDGHVATLTSKNGLPCDQVVAAIEDNDHSMWLYMACGLVRIGQTELDAWVADPGRVLKTTLFDTPDGVRGHAAAGGYSPLMTKSTDGKIWFLPWDGVSVIDPQHIPFNKIPPPVHIEQITADDRPMTQRMGCNSLRMCAI
jgi:ligand-binding sensor domain-containing protein